VPTYRFLTTWCIDAPIERVWDAVYDAARWPEWWPAVERAVKIRDGDENDIGCVWRYTWRSPIRYALELESETTRVERPYAIEGLSRGELVGEGRWRFFEGDITAATYEWNVRTVKPWMNLLAPLARPVFVWNHDAVMRQGGEGLARFLGARLLARS